MRYSLALLAVLAACSNSTGPANHDPSVLITNNTDWPVDFAWRDGQGVAGADTVPGRTERCERFTARPDSAYFEVDATNPNNGNPLTAVYTAPWFHPDSFPAWHAIVIPTGSSPDVNLAPTQTPC
ncbi:MAG TPA: hypothetical protein VKQ05_12960 [Gemmatimonadales bacterium]|nr:hypothetical protein [Gemmatimonadales bacterium]